MVGCSSPAAVRVAAPAPAPPPQNVRACDARVEELRVGRLEAIARRPLNPPLTEFHVVELDSSEDRRNAYGGTAWVYGPRVIVEAIADDVGMIAVDRDTELTDLLPVLVDRALQHGVDLVVATPGDTEVPLLLPSTPPWAKQVVEAYAAKLAGDPDGARRDLLAAVAKASGGDETIVQLYEGPSEGLHFVVKERGCEGIDVEALTAFARALEADGKPLGPRLHYVSLRLRRSSKTIIRLPKRTKVSEFLQVVLEYDQRLREDGVWIVAE